MIYEIRGPGNKELAKFENIQGVSNLYNMVRLYAENSETSEVVLYIDGYPFLSCIFRRVAHFYDVRSGKNAPICCYQAKDLIARKVKL